MFTDRQLCRSLPAWPLRLVALGCAVLVGLLSLAAVSPEIHAALHGHPAEQGEHAGHRDHQGNPAASGHSCAVTLFSQGFESGCTPLLILGAPEPLFTDVIALADQVARAARAAQLPPGRGPPVG
jgi:hypothetical protein